MKDRMECKAWFSGKKILFVSPVFFNYEMMIERKLTSLGAEVTKFDTTPFSSYFEKGIAKFLPKLFSRKISTYYSSIERKISKERFDVILIIKCDYTPRFFLKFLRTTFPETTVVLYLWDSKKNIAGIEEKFEYFDKIYSFDRKDAIEDSRLIFRPLFFDDQYRSGNRDDEYIYDISFIGTVHSDRFEIISKVKKYLDKNNLLGFFYCYLQSKLVYLAYKATKKEFMHTRASSFQFEKISPELITKIVDKSKTVLDIQHPNQTGLTMRTIEMIGLKKKIITTNSDIANYDFYNSRNIKILDREDFIVERSFFEEEYAEIDDVVYERYSLLSWLEDVFVESNYGK